MSFRKPCHMLFRKLIPPFTLTAKIPLRNPYSRVPVDACATSQHPLGNESNMAEVDVLTSD